MNRFKTLLAKNLKRARNGLGLTQQALAEKCEISTNYLATVEIGGKFPSSDTLDKLARSLGLKPYQLFLEESDLEGFDRQELIARFTEKAKRYLTEGLDKTARDFTKRK